MNRLFLILFCCLLGFLSKSQQYHFVTYSIEDGLAQSQVVDIIQDNNSYLWIATRGGLSRFDGIKFKNYSKDNGLISNQISSLFIDNKQNFWVGTEGGFSLFKNRQFVNYYFENDYTRFQVNDFETWGDTLFLATNGGGIVKFFNGKYSYLTEDDGLLSGNIRRIKIIKNVLWIASSRGLQYYDGKNVLTSNIKEIQNLNISSIDCYEDKIAVSTYGDGFFLLEDNTIKAFNESQGLVSNMIRNVSFDSSGKIWLTSKFGFSKYDEGVITNFTEKNGLPINNINCVFNDSERNIWLGSDGKGIQMFAGETFVNYTTEDGLSSDFIMNILQSRNGDMWFSTYGEGVIKQTPNETFYYTSEYGLSNNTVWTSIEDKNGNLWFGTSFGLNKWDGSKFTQFYETDGLMSNKITALFEDEKGIWVGSSKGLNLIRNDTILNPNAKKEILLQNIRSIYKHRGKLFLGTQTGLVVYDYTDFKEYSFISDQDDLPVVYSISGDKEGVWIGTGDGLYYMRKDGKTKRISLDDNFNSKTINFLYTDKQFNTWVGTNNGIFKLTKRGSDEFKLQINHFNNQDGFKSLETNLNAVYEDKNNNLWFGTGGGLVKYRGNLEKEINKQRLPTLHITEIKLFLEEFDFLKYADGVDDNFGLPINLQLPYNKNHLTFSFIGISYKKPKSVRYKFILEGFDVDWSPEVKVLTATYSNIPPGSYTFKVTASEDGQNWTEQVRFSFTIHSPFWLKWWFILLAFAVFFGIVYAVVRARIRTIESKRENEKLSFQKKMLELEQQSLNASMNRHFIFNSLNSIQYFINVSDKKSANRYLSNFAKLIRKNLDISTSENNLTYLSEELERIKLYLSLEMMRFEGKFDYRINIYDDVDTESVKIPSMMLQPFIENSIIHGLLPKEEPDGLIEINISKPINSIEVEIIDNGVGIEKSMSQKEAFYGDHMSKGMLITTRRIELLRKMAAKDFKIIGPNQNNENSPYKTGTHVKIIFPQ